MIDMGAIFDPRIYDRVQKAKKLMKDVLNMR